MTTITFPSTPKPRSMTWRLVQPSQNNINQWTGGRQVLASSRGWWECQIELPPIVGTSNFNPWRAFSANMLGSANDTQVKVDPTPQSSTLNSVLVNGASQSGRSLNTDGWPVSSTPLVAGQFVTIGDQLLQLTQDVTSNASGEATIYFSAAIRVSPADNAAIECNDPYALMYLVEEPAYNVEAGYVYSMSLNLRECF